MKTVCIVGFHGVGKAHAVAAIRNGFLVKAIDLSSYASLESHTTHSTVSNRWLTIEEQAELSNYELQPLEWFYRNTLVDRLDGECLEVALQSDICVVATPNYTHASIYDQLKTHPRLLMEKPSVSLPAIDVAIGFEWLHHSHILGALERVKLGHAPAVFTFAHGGYHSESNLVLDLGSHLCSFVALLATHMQGTVELLGVNTDSDLLGVDETYKTVCMSRATVRINTAVSCTVVHLEAAYLKDPTEIVQIGDTPLLWESDLFGVQLCRLDNGSHRSKLQCLGVRARELCSTWNRCDLMSRNR